MPRFHFNTVDMFDLEGSDLPSLAVAKCEALKLTAGIIWDDAARFWDAAHWCMTVTDEKNLTLFRIEIVRTESPAIRASFVECPA